MADFPLISRRKALQQLSFLGSAALLGGIPAWAHARQKETFPFSQNDFGKDFRWGVALAAFQNEGAWNADGKGESIWDRFNHTKGKIKDHSNADVSCDFYHRYPEDIALAARLGFDSFRFSISWSRIFPSGTGQINQKGVDFYHRVIDTCLENNLQPFITLYHWDLPQALEDRGGWINRDIVNWFSEYANTVTRLYGDKAKNWCVLNEPMGFIGLGYVQGIHAPGHKKMMNFFPGVLHAGLCQAEGGRIVKNNVKNAYAGTTFSCSHVDPASSKEKDIKAALRMDALLNRLFIEPLVGMGYPVKDLPFLTRMERYMQAGDDKRLQFDFDFIGLQYYFRVVGKNAFWMPLLHSREIPAEKRDVPMSEMKREIYPEGMYHILKKFSTYPIKEILVTENGCCVPDLLENGQVHDTKRIAFFSSYLQQLLKAKREGVNVKGYFVWTLTDNFEWNEGYAARFGIVYTDFASQKRYIKDSGYCFQQMLQPSSFQQA